MGPRPAATLSIALCICWSEGSHMLSREAGLWMSEGSVSDHVVRTISGDTYEGAEEEVLRLRLLLRHERAPALVTSWNPQTLQTFDRRDQGSQVRLLIFALG